jgi:catechol 2,3-dioxygenase-like lactoylglutathione lyase family enzyme
MKVQVIGIPVLEQEAALQFYTGKLGFVKKLDIPLGGGSRWLTVVSNEDPDGPEILLEPSPNHFEPAKTYQRALLDAGIPYTQFNVEDVNSGVTDPCIPVEADPGYQVKKNSNTKSGLLLFKNIFPF